MLDTRTTQTMSNADKAQNKSRDLSKIDILDDHTNWDNIYNRIAEIKAQKNKSRDLSKIDILDDNTDWEKMKLTTQKLIAQKNKKAFNCYQDEDNTTADMLYQRMEQSKQKQK